MITFTVPVKTKRSQDAGEHFRFSVPKRGVVLAGSRNLNLPYDYCSSMVDAFGNLGFSFFVGCAAGVDRSFRKALAVSNWNDKTLMACRIRHMLEALPGGEGIFSRGTSADHRTVSIECC